VAMGRYPYDNTGFTNIFDQLNAIVNGEPPALPADRYSQSACNFVASCLIKKADERPVYQDLLQHPWLIEAEQTFVDMEDWAARAHALFLARHKRE
ncbi:MAP kinase kinase Wis1, partial [Coemansia sp. RSA 486]